MKQVTIAFDCDGTLVTTDSATNGRIVANERIRSMLVTFASFKNVHIIVWSGGGEMWARQVVAELGLKKYVNEYMAKKIVGRDADNHPIIETDFTPDIAVDDIQSCELGMLNMIVREK